MTKSPHAFRSIGEVARLVGVATHVLRYWETQFPALSPVKRPDGRRYYRLDDVLLAAGICEALREEGLTIRGARRLIAQDRGAGLRDQGRRRLGERLRLTDETASPAPAVPATRASAEPGTPERVDALPDAAVTAVTAAGTGPGPDRPARPRRPLRPAADDETLPLFPDLEPAHAAAATQGAGAPDMSSAGVVWLGRLCATAAILRRHDSALPEDARHHLAALRDACTAPAGIAPS